MSATTEFKSYVSVAQRSALERLIFFNSCQDRVSDCIADAIEKFGAPEIVADRDRLRIYMKGTPDVQSLFALDREGRPVGVAVYARQDVEHITVMHLRSTRSMRAAARVPANSCYCGLLREVRRSTTSREGRAARRALLRGEPALAHAGQGDVLTARAASASRGRQPDRSVVRAAGRDARPLRMAVRSVRALPRPVHAAVPHRRDPAVRATGAAACRRGARRRRRWRNSHRQLHGRDDRATTPARRVQGLASTRFRNRLRRHRRFIEQTQADVS